MNNPHHQWNFRPPPPPQANGICPICSIFHFPFCSPPPPPPPPSYAPQNPRFPTRPGHDPRPWHYNVHPHVDRQNLVQPMYDYHGGANGFVSDCERHYNKRLRVDESSYQVSLEDERRLKLIRDHGGNWAGNKPFSNCNGFNSFDNHVDYSSLQDNDWQKHGPNNQPPPPPPPPPPPLPSYPPLPLPHHAYDDFNVQRGYLPPLPTSPPPPMPVQSPLPPPVRPSTSLFPVPVSVSSACPSVPHASTEFISEYPGESQSFPLRQLSPDKPKLVDAFHLFKQPHRSTRPDHFVIIIRGLPGSGKSYIAKKLRDLEVENGGDAPRIHSMDDYFMTEVEKNEEGDASKASGSCRSKKAATKIVMEYCYEPEMEEAYRSSMLKAFTRTLDEGNFTFVIVDDRNLRVADFAQFWATAKRSGYEAYILEATYKDPAGCAARNIHGFTLDEIEKMAGQWEESPTLYWQLDIKSLFHGDDLKESRIKEVEMDMDDVDFESPSAQQVREPNSNTVSRTRDDVAAGFPRNEKRSDVEGDLPAEIVKDLGRSKWSNDLDEDDDENTNVKKGNLNPLSGLFQMYGKEGKSVRWGDQVSDTGFSIGAAEKAKMLSLVIGPGAGYNLKSNPLPKEGSVSTQSTANLKQGAFKERLRAEHESFKSVFDRRRQQIGVLGSEEEP